MGTTVEVGHGHPSPRGYGLSSCSPPSPLPCAGTAEAQFRASIQGTVNDSSGAAVPGATVVVTNQETGVSSETVTGEAGFYRVSALSPGKYKVTASLAGFKEAVAENVEVAAEEARGLDLALEAGNIQETVTVTAARPTLRTENAEISGTFSSVEVKALPQVGRDPYELVRLAPGVFGLGARDGAGNSVGVPNQQGPGGSNSSIFGTENQVPVSANGQRVEANNFQLDGVTAMSQAWGGAAVVTPNQESVKEIRVISSSYSAENGRNTGAQVQVVSQNGTNDFHGSLVFKRNTPGLNSYQSDDWVGPAGELPERVNRRLSQTAGSFGGPLFRNKLFFFFSFEASNSKRQLPMATEWVETPELVNAIKSQRPNSIAAQFLNYPGMTPPNIARVLNTVDVGSLTGSQGQTVADALGGGLDGVPDLQQRPARRLREPDRTPVQRPHRLLGDAVGSAGLQHLLRAGRHQLARPGGVGQHGAPGRRLHVGAPQHGGHAALDAHALADDAERGAVQRDAVVLRRDRVEPRAAVGAAAALGEPARSAPRTRSSATAPASGRASSTRRRTTSATR